MSKDQPFRFPAELTFVVRAFSVLDGIGKSLNKKFDIGEISAPYARNLLIDDNPSALPPAGRAPASATGSAASTARTRRSSTSSRARTPSRRSPMSCARLSAAG